MTQETDEQLVEQARQGNKPAFRELVKRLEPRVAATVIGMLGRCPEADDVGQEVFIRFYQALNKFRGESSVSSYVTRIAINLSLNELRRKKRLSSIFTDTDSADAPETASEGSEQMSFEDKEMIKWALEKLPPDYRAVIVLRLIDGYSTYEAADILKIPVGTATSRLARAQKQMKEILMPYFGDER